MIADVLTDAGTRMDRAVEAAKDDFATVRTGRANPQLFQTGIGTLGGGDIDITAGGTLRDLVLGRAPVFWVERPGLVVAATGVAAIADEIEDKMLENGFKRLRREGRDQARWVLLDFGDLVVHVFHEEERTFYGLERLWKDCPVISVELPARAE